MSSSEVPRLGSQEFKNFTPVSSQKAPGDSRKPTVDLHITRGITNLSRSSNKSSKLAHKHCHHFDLILLFRVKIGQFKLSEHKSRYVVMTMRHSLAKWSLTKLVAGIDVGSILDQKPCYCLMAI